MRSLNLTVLALVLVGGGCGGSEEMVDVYPTTGKLTMDGQPFGPTRIRLLPTAEGGRSVAGSVDESGTITFTTYEKGDGAPAGEYKVVVGMEMAEPPKPFPRIYREQGKTPLMVSVAEQDGNELTIDLESKAGPLVGGPSFGADAMKKSMESPAFSAGADSD